MMDLDVKIIVSILAIFTFVLSFMDEGDRHHL